MEIITIELVAQIRKQYRLKWHGTHGIIHWHRVYQNGIRLSEQEGVNHRVLQLFSVFHDSQRKNEHWDKHHGKRGAELAKELRRYCPLDDAEFELLTTACELHTNTLDVDVFEWAEEDNLKVMFSEDETEYNQNNIKQERMDKDFLAYCREELKYHDRELDRAKIRLNICMLTFNGGWTF